MHASNTFFWAFINCEKVQVRTKNKLIKLNSKGLQMKKIEVVEVESPVIFKVWQRPWGKCRRPLLRENTHKSLINQAK
jgi:hypothetical protein